MDIPIPPELALDAPPFNVELVDSGVERPRWRIENDGEAEWALRHLAEATMAVTTVEDNAAEWRRRIDEYVERTTRPLRRRVDFFEAHLEDYALRVRDASAGELKTVKLPSGDVVTRETPARIKIADPALWQAWAEEHVDEPIVRAKYELNAGEAKAAFVVTHDVVGYLHTMTLSCGATIDEQLEEMAGEWELDAPCPECGPAGIRERCAVLDVTVAEVVRHVVRDRDTGFPVEWADAEPPRVSAKVKF